MVRESSVLRVVPVASCFFYRITIATAPLSTSPTTNDGTPLLAHDSTTPRNTPYYFSFGDRFSYNQDEFRWVSVKHDKNGREGRETRTYKEKHAAISVGIDYIYSLNSFFKLATTDCSKDKHS